MTGRMIPSICVECETRPVAWIDNNPLCNHHVEQWAAVITRHAPLDSGIRPRDGNVIHGGTTHKPRHY